MAILTSIKRLKSHLEALAIPRDCFQNAGNLLKVEKYIENHFTSFGYRIEKHAFKYREVMFHNLIARHPRHSSRASAKRIVVGAHFDSVPGTPAADDNASGVAGMLEIASVLSDRDLPQPVDFIAFNAEEYGMIGSLEYVKDLPPDQRHQIDCMLSLEMIGYASNEKGSQKIPLVLKPFYPDKGNFAALVGNLKSGKALRRLARCCDQTASAMNSVYHAEKLTVPFNGKVLPAVRLSDHSPFWDQGIPAILVTDTSFFRNPHYHKSTDSIETIDFNFMQYVCEGVLQFVSSLESS